MLLCLYVLVLPIMIAESSSLPRTSFFGLLLYDIVFLIDRVLDLFVGFINKEGHYEPSLRNVVFKNFSSIVYLELFFVASPFLILEEKSIASMPYFLIKLPRFNRLFDME